MTTPELREARLKRVQAAKNPSGPPSDFVDFWKETLLALLAIDPQPALEVPSLLGVVPRLTTFRSLHDASISCWMSAPSDPKDDAPLVVTSHGYGGAIDEERMRRLASLGIFVVGVEPRGFGKSRSAVSGLSPYGYVATGAESEQTSILRGAVADYLQAYRAALCVHATPRSVTFQGFSFAGGLALMAAGVLEMGAITSNPPPPTLLAIGAPTFGFLERRLELCEGGSGKQLQELLADHPEKAGDIIRVLSYFDATFFPPHFRPGKAPRVSCGVGLDDPIVPAETVYAIVNAFVQRPEVFEFPCSHTDRPEEAQWQRWESAWIRTSLKG